jgi:APA family basic amino acid/polyamine antiporter
VPLPLKERAALLRALVFRLAAKETHALSTEIAAGEAPRVGEATRPWGPTATLTAGDAVALIIGVVVGAGIFRSPSLVATNVGSEGALLLAWLLGGIVSLTGALCYAEVAAAYPHAGGDYHYLTRAFGKDVSFLFAWARMMVIQTGSIATVAFVFGDYIAQALPFGGPVASPIAAASAVVLLTALNIIGTQQGKWTQNLLTFAKAFGLLLVIAAGLALARRPDAEVAAGHAGKPAFGLAMVFVLYTYGGWNEAAYISAELHNPQRNMLRSLLWSVGAITLLYMLVNVAYVKGLGLAGMAGSSAVAADLMGRALGSTGSQAVAVLVAIAALGATNACIFTGARTNYALGLDAPRLSFLGQWHKRGTPVRALLVQGGVALALVILGALTRKGFETMVDYTVPVFWFFFLLAGLSLFVLRTREPERHRPFRVPLYPLTPLAFCAFCLYMLHSSLAYAGQGALLGVAVLLAGIPVLMVCRRGPRRDRTPEQADE